MEEEHSREVFPRENESLGGNLDEESSNCTRSFRLLIIEGSGRNFPRGNSVRFVEFS